MKLDAKQVATVARSECQFVRTNSGDAVYVFVHEGLLRFAERIVAGEKAHEVTLPQPGLINTSDVAMSNWQRVQELEGKLFEASESIINIGRECNHWKAKAGEVEVELQAVRVERNQYKNDCIVFNSQLASVIAENTHLFNQVALIAGDRDKSNRRLVEMIAERDDLQRKVEENCKAFIKIDSCIEDWRKI